MCFYKNIFLFIILIVNFYSDNIFQENSYDINAKNINNPEEKKEENINNLEEKKEENINNLEEKKEENINNLEEKKEENIKSKLNFNFRKNSITQNVNKNRYIYTFCLIFIYFMILLFLIKIHNNSPKVFNLQLILLSLFGIGVSIFNFTLEPKNKMFKISMILKWAVVGLFILLSIIAWFYYLYNFIKNNDKNLSFAHFHKNLIKNDYNDFFTHNNNSFLTSLTNYCVLTIYLLISLVFHIPDIQLYKNLYNFNAITKLQNYKIINENIDNQEQYIFLKKNNINKYCNNIRYICSSILICIYIFIIFIVNTEVHFNKQNTDHDANNNFVYMITSLSFLSSLVHVVSLYKIKPYHKMFKTYTVLKDSILIIWFILLLMLNTFFNSINDNTFFISSVIIFTSIFYINDIWVYLELYKLNKRMLICNKKYEDSINLMNDNKKYEDNINLMNDNKKYEDSINLMNDNKKYEI